MSDDVISELLTLTVEVDEDGTIRYFNHLGQKHRVHGPAVIRASSGTYSWWMNGQRHRTDGPAVEWSCGSKEWFHHGTAHRADGPAVEWSNGDVEWWLNGEYLTEEEWYGRINTTR